MSPRKTAIFALVMVALGAFYYFYVYKEEQKKTKREEAARKLWLVSVAEVEELIISRDGKEFRVKKEGDKYQIIYPIKAKADDNAVKALLALLLRAEKERRLSDASSELAAYGLQQPKLQVSIKAKGKGENWVVFGNANVSGEYVFAKHRDNKEVFLVPVVVKRVADRTLYDLRDKTVLAVAKGKVTKLEVSYQGTRLVVEKDDKGHWQLTKPLPARGGKEEIDRFLGKLSELKAAGFKQDSPKDLAPLGLVKPVSWIKVWHQGEPEPATLMIGSRDKQGRFNAKLTDKAEVFLLDNKFVAGLPNKPDDLRERSPLIFEVLKVDKVSLARDGLAILAEKKEGKWQILTPSLTPAAEVRMNAWLWDIRELKAKRFIDTYPKGLKAYGLDNPSASLTLWSENKKFTLLMGKLGETTFYAKDKAARVIYVLDKKRGLKPFQRTLDDIQDKRLFPVDQKVIREIHLQRKGFKVILKKAKERWEVVEPSPRDLVVEPMQAWIMFWNLRDATFEKEVAAKAEDLSPYGLDKPVASIEMRDKEGRRIDLLKLGRVTVLGKADKIYGKLESRPAIYFLERDLLDKVPTSEVDL